MLWIIVSLLIIVIDQVSKYIIVQNVAPGEMIPVIDRFFYLTLHKNPGAAWGILQNSQMLFLVIIPIISIVVLYFMAKNNNRFLRFSLAFILGGAAGNYIDRLFEGKVTDFLLFYIGSYPFPIFNAADMAITFGTILLAIYMLFIYKEPPKRDQADATCQSKAGDVREAIYQGEAGNNEETDSQSAAEAQSKSDFKIKTDAGIEADLENKAESQSEPENHGETENQGQPENQGELKDAE